MTRRALEGPAVPPPRWTGLAMPPYRYVPGLQPHPFRHPQGHAWCGGGAPPPLAWHPQEHWQDEQAYVRGLELMAHRYWWEAHEVFEGIWTPLPRDTALAQLLQALVQASAAALQLHLGRARAARTLCDAVEGRLALVMAQHGPCWRGVALDQVVPEIRAAQREGRAVELAQVVVNPPPRTLRVVCGAVISQGCVLAAQRRDGTDAGGAWELPGGKVELHEQDKEALARELSEELDMEVVVAAPLGEIFHAYPHVRLRLAGYVCQPGARPPRCLEHHALRWLTPSTLDSVAWSAADQVLLPALRAHLAG